MLLRGVVAYSRSNLCAFAKHERFCTVTLVHNNIWFEKLLRKHNGGMQQGHSTTAILPADRELSGDFCGGSEIWLPPVTCQSNAFAWMENGRNEALGARFGAGLRTGKVAEKIFRERDNVAGSEYTSGLSPLIFTYAQPCN